ncbi:MAG TPA: DUF262 domain-containing protein [Bacteroides togonis]|nr:DUF262 domain-containing protein [Bacteroides togonis]
MENRVYYGEYSLKHWINLMLKRNIILPEYQRSFVWDEKDVKRLIKSLGEGQFVQPITIANYNSGNKEHNLLLDGQQRLTSILLSYLGYIPDKDKFASIEKLASADDSEEESDNPTKIIGWTFEDMLDDDCSKNTIKSIKEKIEKTGKYKELKITSVTNNETFFENIFLGFSYIIPNRAEEDETQRFFSTLFRNMNYLGMRLSPLESRRSLYYLDNNLKRYFDGLTSEDKDVLCDIKLFEKMQLCKIDIVRYTSILSQYVANSKEPKKVLVGYSAYASRENYYADYVSYIIGLEQADRPDKFNEFDFSKTFPDNNWLESYNSIRTILDTMKARMGLDTKKHAFTSWIDADYWLFGLIYFVLFEKKTIDLEKDNLFSEILSIIKEKREDVYYSKNTNRLSNLRDRIQSSIHIYRKYAR